MYERCGKSNQAEINTISLPVTMHHIDYLQYGSLSDISFDSKMIYNNYTIWFVIWLCFCNIFFERPLCACKLSWRNEIFNTPT